MSSPTSRLRKAELRTGFVDLRATPPCEPVPPADQIGSEETFDPLGVGVCEQRVLVHLPAATSGDEICSDVVELVAAPGLEVLDTTRAAKRSTS